MRVFYYLYYYYYFIPSSRYSKDYFSDKLENYVLLGFSSDILLHVYSQYPSRCLTFLASVNLTKTHKTKRPRNHIHVCLGVSHKSVSIFTCLTEFVTVSKSCVLLILRTLFQL